MVQYVTERTTGDHSLNIEIHPVNSTTLIEYSTVPMRYEVESRFRVDLLDDGLGGMVLSEERISPAYMRDFDVLDGEGPTRWLKKFDTSNWSVFFARKDGVAVSAAMAIFRTPNVFLLGGRDDITVLWDIRVAPEHKRSGVGSALLSAVADWAKTRGCDYLKVETQDINVPACRFYHKQGCRLGEINRFAYTEPWAADDVMLVWYLDLRVR